MLKRVAPVLLLAGLVAAPAQAGQAEICYGAIVPSGTFAPPTNSTVFSCPTLGQQTLPQLAALGWSVVQISPLAYSSTTQAVQLVIQKP
jgi:hypothetical protein